MTVQLLGIYYYNLNIMSQCDRCRKPTNILYKNMDGQWDMMYCGMCIDIDKLEYDLYIDTMWGCEWRSYRVVVTNIKLARRYDQNWIPDCVRSTIQDHIQKHKL